MLAAASSRVFFYDDKLFVYLFCSRFVPYIGIVTILMNDYPKFKVRVQLYA